MTLLSLLARDTGLSLKDVRRLVGSAPKRYKTYPIPKNSGGYRVIAQPALEIKELQRILVSRVLRQLPVHDAAYAYVAGKSIRGNAAKHRHSEYILKLDFKNFFNSIRPVDLERVLLRSNLEDVNKRDFEDIFYLAYWGAGFSFPRFLSIGAPSSPIISNIVMFDFDVKAKEAADRFDVVYTRYADDITASGLEKSKLLGFEREITRIIQSEPIGIRLNEDKRGLYGRGERRMVTGLKITPDGAISIGRERKREIRAAIYNLCNGRGDDRLLMRCKGMLAFVISAEPSFLMTLRKTFGREAITQILRAPQIRFYKEDDIFE